MKTPQVPTTYLVVIALMVLAFTPPTVLMVLLDTTDLKAYPEATRGLLVFASTMVMLGCGHRALRMIEGQV